MQVYNHFALRQAAANGNKSVVNLILKYYNNLNDIKHEAIRIAFYYGQENIVKLILDSINEPIIIDTKKG